MDESQAVNWATINERVLRMGIDISEIKQDIKDDRISLKASLADLTQSLDKRDDQFVTRYELGLLITNFDANNKTFREELSELQGLHQELKLNVDKLLGWRNFIAGAVALGAFALGIVADAFHVFKL
ncbi:MAG: hypothetical protein OWR52_04090 [Acidibacillus sp.]|nr:hypothetical protein [Acidibacillus sp.]